MVHLKDDHALQMSELIEKLFSVADNLESSYTKWHASKHEVMAAKFEEAAGNVGLAWSGSWLGYQAKVYYAGLHTPPAGAHFSREWGLNPEIFSNNTTGDWHEYRHEDVVSRINSIAAVTQEDLVAAGKAADGLEEVFEQSKSDFLSAITIVIQAKSDPFLENIKREVEKMKPLTANEFVRVMQPDGKFFTRDMIAAGQGFVAPPHIAALAHAFTLKQPADLCEKLAKMCRRAASHLEVVQNKTKEKQRIGTNVFIGHGGSPAWKDLKDFIQDRLKLPWDEFNRVPVAGITNIARLSQMLNEAAIALLVMTAEDEQKNGKVQARMNVIHEAGLFQGRLGFSRAIIILEEGCEEFSNIQGLGQIRFPKGKIKLAFEDVRQVLEREGLLES